MGFLSRRFAFAVPVLLGVSIVVFLTVKIIPGDPAALLAGPGAQPADVAALRDRLGLARIHLHPVLAPGSPMR